VSDIIPFTKQELELIAQCRELLHVHDPNLAASLLDSKVEDLEMLAGIVGRSASITADLGLSSNPRSLETLAAKLINQGIEEVVNLPAKASLGRSYSISKLHLYQEKRILSCYYAILFSLMAEDLFISIISDSRGHENWTRRATRDLIMMWEKRSNAQADSFAPRMQHLWEIRNTLVPVLGTLLGTSELFQLSFRLPPTWQDFLQERGKDKEVVYALDEFLFSLSYEQLKNLRAIMEAEGISAVSREEAHLLLKLRPSQLLEGPNANDLPAIRLYRSFLRRNTLAKLRRDSDRPGPRCTLEQHLLLYLWFKDEYS